MPKRKSNGSQAEEVISQIIGLGRVPDTAAHAIYNACKPKEDQVHRLKWSRLIKEALPGDCLEPIALPREDSDEPLVFFSAPTFRNFSNGS